MRRWCSASLKAPLRLDSNFANSFSSRLRRRSDENFSVALLLEILSLQLVPTINSARLIIACYGGFEEVGFYVAFSFGVGEFFQMFVGVFAGVFVEWGESDGFESVVGEPFGVLDCALFGES